MILMTLLCLGTWQCYVHAYPYPQPHPYAVVLPPNTPQNQFGDNFDKTQFKPPELEETIEEVQKILQKDPTLPRLTRGEIEELYEKVTREEYQKSVEAGDIGRADSMRALMLVLPYNTDNSTAAKNLEELYTRPPVTKVIDGYTQHPPIKFLTPDPTRTDTTPNDASSSTTYKTVLPFNAGPGPTTYHPIPPAPVMQKLTVPSGVPEVVYDFQPITNPVSHAATQAKANLSPQIQKSPQRFSSHYNAKNTDFLKLAAQQKPKTSTVRPVADVLETLGIVGQLQSRNRYGIDDYYAAESAPKPVISSYVPLTGAEFEGLRGQSISPKIRADAYSSFKPLNIGEEIRVKPEVEDYLTRFGIVGGRKRKALKKGSTTNDLKSIEQTGAGSEIKSASLPSDQSKNSAAELEKLLENLQELERINSQRKSSKPATSSTTTSTTTTTTTTTTAAPTKRVFSSTTESTIPSLITNGDPILIEAKKPRRRIDPHIDINFAATGNQQPIQTNEDQLTKLLENLQELERLRLNPENILKTVAPTIKANRLATKPMQKTTKATTTTTTTTSTTPAPKLQSNDQLQLQRLLKELQAFDETNVKSTTTKKPINVRPTPGATLDLLQLRKLLTDDDELERLYEQARRKVAPKSTTTTSRPTTRDFELEQLQKYLAQLDKATSTTSTTTSTTTTTTTTPRPPPPTKLSTDAAQIQQLINRVQQLERLNSNKPAPQRTTTESSLPYLGFTSRNVKAPTATAADYRVPSNDFAQLQQLYRQVQQADAASFSQVEISTAATAPKNTHKNTADFAQHLIDFTNDTGPDNEMPKVEPDEFVQLQKLLLKVQELERVKINPNDATALPTPNPQSKKKFVTLAPNLVTAASIQAPNVQRPSAQLIYPESSGKHQYVDFAEEVEDDLKSVLPVNEPHNVIPKKSATIGQIPIATETISSEEIRELAHSKPINPKQSTLDQDFEQYQEFFASLEDAGERNSYRISYENMEPPMIKKTVVKEPPRFVATKKPHEVVKAKPLTGQQQSDLAELQKLLNNAQELEKLGVTLPKSLSDRIESKLSKTTPIIKPTKAAKTVVEPEYNVYLDRYGLKQKITPNSNEDSSEKIAVFSLTTPKTVEPKPTKTTTDSSPSDLPVFSATKIIEAAIKKAANRIGVTTEQPKGFRRRIDDDIDFDLTVDDADANGSDGDDMVGDFSEMNYQIAIPEINRMDESNGDEQTFVESTTKPMDLGSTDLSELQRLIGNLQELQRLNVSISSDMVHLADTKYLESFKNKLTTADETSKSRRQSATTSSAATLPIASSTSSTAPDIAAVDLSTTTTESTISSNNNEDSSSTSIGIGTTPTAPTRVTLGIGLEDSDAVVAGNENSSTTSSSSSTTSTTTEGTTTTEESRNGSLADLEDSFGPDPNKEEPLPPKKKNGFYFLADWNSFLEVGDGDDQVVVRFSPKIGDPRLFLPVKIP